MAAGTASNAGSASLAPAKRKAKLQQPLPAVEALAEQQPFCVEVKPRVGRMAVAKVDMPAGTLVMMEEPVATVARTRLALHVCHRCFVPIPPPTKPQKPSAAKQLEDKPAAAAEEDKEDKEKAEGQQNGDDKAVQAEKEKEQEQDTPPALDPCLPRYCTACVGKNAELDARLAAVRSRLLSVCKKHGLEPELLQLLLLLDVQRAAPAAPGKRPAVQDVPSGWAPEGSSAPPTIRCTSSDMDCVPSMWDSKGPGWRKMVVAATRALHTELVALAESGAVPGYTPSSLAHLQAVAGAIGLCMQGVGAEGSNNEPGLGLFPAMTLFPHSCAPNCSFMVSGQTLRVRALVDIPAGTPLNVSYVSLYEPRSARHDSLRSQRAQAGCGCIRCVQPIEQSTDRFLEGVWCLRCRVNVLVQLPPSDKQEEEFKAQQEKEEAEDAALSAVSAAEAAPAGAAASASSKKAGKKAGKKGAAAGGKEGDKAAGETAAEAAAEAAPEAAAAAAAEEPAKAEDAAAEGEAAGQANGEGKEADRAVFWKCCGCGHMQRARGANGLPGPLDLDEQATSIFHNAMMLLQMKVPQAVPQAENMLSFVRGGLNGRLHPYNIHCLDAQEPLLSLQMRKGDALGVFNTALSLWEAQRLLLDLPNSTQLQLLAAIEDAARHKAENASSSVVKKQFERKAKAAQTEIAYLRRVLYGQQ